MNRVQTEEEAHGCAYGHTLFWVYATGRAPAGHATGWGYSVRLGARRVQPYGFHTRREAITDAHARIDRWRHKRREAL